MAQSQWLTAKDVLRVNAFKWKNKTGIKDLNKSFTFEQWNERSCRLANALSGLGMKKGDRFAVLGYNCVEWMECYAAAAKGGFICVPIMFRLAAPEMEHILNHCEAKVFIVQDQWRSHVDGFRENLLTVEKYISFAVQNDQFDAYLSYEDLISKADSEEPDVEVGSDDIWVLMYTGGTTGFPKGVMKSHGSLMANYLIEIYEHGFVTSDIGLLVMPCCHVNSLYMSFVITWIGGTVMCYNADTFVPEDLLKVISEHKITFTSLVPTHYIMMLNLPEEVKKKYELSSIKRLLISSAPARRDTKLAIMAMFPNSELYEGYGSTETGLVTVLKPDEQLDKLGSCGREAIGTDIIRLYDENGKLIIEPGKIGELYTRSPMMFSGYWKDEEKLNQAKKGDYFTAGDMAMRDKDGYIYLVDRKANMVISGGENVYPTEVENCAGSHPKIKDIAVIGVPHEKWGEQVIAIAVLRDGETAASEEIRSYCKGKIAGYKVPKEVIFIKDEDMPRSGIGKILHRELRKKYASRYCS